MAVFLKAWNSKLPTTFESRNISEVLDRQGIFGTIDVDKESPYYPKRGDTKIMRTDVIASIISIGEMMAPIDLTEEQLAQTALYIANGCFLEEENKHINKLIRAFEKYAELETKEEQTKLLFRNIPPLTALETLTNSTMSFIAQYSRIKGNNTTFGNTSHSSFEALKAAFSQIKYRKYDLAMAGGANGSGIYSALNYLDFYPNKEEWKESLCCAFVLLGSEKGDSNIEIEACIHDSVVPSLVGNRKKNNWKQFADDKYSLDAIIYSGGFTNSIFEENKKYAEALCEKSFSINEKYGHTGAASMILNLIEGTKLINESGYKRIGLLDRDPYGRESFVILKHT